MQKFKLAGVGIEKYNYFSSLVNCLGVIPV